VKQISVYLFSICIFLSCSTSENVSNTENDNKSFEKLRKDLGDAFISGDTQVVSAYHHPDVVKALSYNKLVFGRDAVVTEFANTTKYYTLAFIEHKIESFEIHGNTATEISSFTVKGTPKNTDSDPFIFKGRSMVVYIRYSKSPAGWVLYRETVQPASN
jgi:ketosteroid isomerase-like protein